MRNFLIAFVGVLGITAHGTIARAQAVPSLPPVELTAQIGYLPLYGGDATVGSIGTWAASARAAYRLPLGPQHIALEAYLAHAPQDRDPYNRAPAFTFVGALLRISLAPTHEPASTPFWESDWGGCAWTWRRSIARRRTALPKVGRASAMPA